MRIWEGINDIRGAQDLGAMYLLHDQPIRIVIRTCNKYHRYAATSQDRERNYYVRDHALANEW